MPVAGASVLIDVHVAGIGFPDLLFAHGAYQDLIEPPFVPGYEVAGTIRSAPRACGFEPGTRVLGFTMRGGHAEVAAADPSLTLVLPDELSDEEAIRLGTNYQTAHLALVRRARAQAGETAVVFGAGGGLGNAVVDLASALGLEVVAVASSEEKRSLALAAGASYALAPGEGLAGAVRELLPRRADLVLDPVGGALTTATRLLAPGGRLVLLGFASGEIESVPANQLLVRNADAIGVVWGSSVEREPALASEIWGELLCLHAEGRLRPPQGPTFPLEQAPQVLEQIAARRLVGKAVLRVR